MFIAHRRKWKSKAPEERNVSLRNKSVRHFARLELALFFGPTVYKHFVPTGLPMGSQIFLEIELDAELEQTTVQRRRISCCEIRQRR